MVVYSAVKCDLIVELPSGSIGSQLQSFVALSKEPIASDGEL